LCVKERLSKEGSCREYYRHRPFLDVFHPNFHKEGTLPVSGKKKPTTPNTPDSTQDAIPNLWNGVK
jgi:hypothetical protein